MPERESQKSEQFDNDASEAAKRIASGESEVSLKRPEDLSPEEHEKWQAQSELARELATLSNEAINEHDERSLKYNEFHLHRAQNIVDARFGLAPTYEDK